MCMQHSGYEPPPSKTASTKGACRVAEHVLQEIINVTSAFSSVLAAAAVRTARPIPNGLGTS